MVATQQMFSTNQCLNHNRYLALADINPSTICNLHECGGGCNPSTAFNARSDRAIVAEVAFEGLAGLGAVSISLPSAIRLLGSSRVRRPGYGLSR